MEAPDRFYVIISRDGKLVMVAIAPMVPDDIIPAFRGAPIGVRFEVPLPERLAEFLQDLYEEDEPGRAITHVLLQKGVFAWVWHKFFEFGWNTSAGALYIPALPGQCELNDDVYEAGTRCNPEVVGMKYKALERLPGVDIRAQQNTVSLQLFVGFLSASFQAGFVAASMFRWRDA
jgi:hypothetical protein